MVPSIVRRLGFGTRSACTMDAADDDDVRLPAWCTRSQGRKPKESRDLNTVHGYLSGSK